MRTSRTPLPLPHSSSSSPSSCRPRALFQYATRVRSHLLPPSHPTFRAKPCTQPPFSPPPATPTTPLPRATLPTLSALFQVLEELERLPPASRSAAASSTTFVHISDLDEILDLPAVVSRVAGTAAIPMKRVAGSAAQAARAAHTSQGDADGEGAPPPLPHSPPPFNCMSPKLRYFFYGPHCAKVRPTPGPRPPPDHPPLHPPSRVHVH